MQELSKGTSRRVAAACFHEVLQLKSWDYINLIQENPLADITISPTVTQFRVRFISFIL
jgi:hypothetical protein